MTREQYLAYMKVYNKKYNERRRPTENREMLYGGDYLNIQPTELNFKGTDRDEPVVCSKFGCSKHLLNEEKRFGKYCVEHQGNNKIDYTLVLSYPIKQTG